METDVSANSGLEQPNVSPLTPIFRRAILLGATNPVVAAVVRRYGMRLGAARFVAGETFEEAMPVLKGLNERGLRTNTTLLGEGVRDDAAAQRVVDDYRSVLDRIADAALTTNVALKLTHLGLDLGEEVAWANVLAIVERAESHSNFIRIDMEESDRVDATLRIFRRLREEGHEQVGTVLQSALHRTEDDLRRLVALRPNLRLVKGAYLEPAAVAHQRKAAVDAAYLRLAERMLGEIPFTAIATHDERMIERVIGLASARGLGPEQYEFQMLYGIRPKLQGDLARQGHRVLVATPFGPQWYPYLMRRLAERPANLLFFGQSLVRR